MDWIAFATGLGTLTLIYGLLAVGLNTQFGFTGVLNFGYVAFFAVGAFTSAVVTLPPPGSAAYVEAGARYTIGLGQPFLLGLVLAGLAGGLLALLIGATSIRLQAHYLAVATFAMAEVVRSVLINETWLTRGEFGITNVPQPGKGALVAEDAYAYAYLLLALIVVALAVAVTMRVTNRPFGRLLRAIRDDEIAARALAKPTTAAKLKALVLGGVLAGIAGSVWTHSLGVVHVGQFVPIITFQIWLAMLLGGVGNHWGVLVGAVMLVAIREGTRFIGDVPGLAELAAAHPGALPSLRFVIIGLLLILVIRYFPRGVLPEVRRHAPGPSAQAVAGTEPTPAPALAPQGEAEQLTVEGVEKRFGGVTAVNGASFTIRRGGITGLIGPNGAGKSTMLDLISGIAKPDRGRVAFEGEAVTGLAPEAIARRGLVRSFQTPRLFMSMTAWENLMTAGSAPHVETVTAALASGERLGAHEREAAARAAEVLAFLKLDKVTDRLASELSGGQRKLLSLGRLLMMRPAMMLLDEPAAGVNRVLARELFERIAELNRRGITFVIVEHDMDLIMRYCDHVIVMHNGAVLAEGSPADIRRHPAVIDAYLGGAA